MFKRASYQPQLRHNVRVIDAYLPLPCWEHGPCTLQPWTFQRKGTHTGCRMRFTVLVLAFQARGVKRAGFPGKSWWRSIATTSLHHSSRPARVGAIESRLLSSRLAASRLGRKSRPSSRTLLWFAGRLFLEKGTSEDHETRLLRILSTEFHLRPSPGRRVSLSLSQPHRIFHSAFNLGVGVLNSALFCGALLVSQALKERPWLTQVDFLMVPRRVALRGRWEGDDVNPAPGLFEPT